MFSVMNDFEIDRNHDSADDLSFFGMESPKEEEEEESMDPIEPEIPPPVDLPPVESPDLEESKVGVSSAVDEQQLERSPPTVHEPEPEPEPELDDEDDADMNGFAPGDMVWGKVKSHPWWPGHIFNESFASPDVVGTKRDGYVLVAFFGDSSYGWFNPEELIPFEPNFLEKSRQTTMKSFVRAVEESVDETSRRAGLGLACRCQNPYNFRPTGVPNYFAVDVIGYERNGIYSRRQINRERESFDAKRAVDFLRQLAVKPRWSDRKDADWYRNVSQAFAVRRIRFEDFDETYAQAFGQNPVRPAVNEMGVPEQAENFAPRGINALMPVLKVHVLYLNSLDCLNLVSVFILFYKLICIASRLFLDSNICVICKLCYLRWLRVGSIDHFSQLLKWITSFVNNFVSSCMPNRGFHVFRSLRIQM